MCRAVRLCALLGLLLPRAVAAQVPIEAIELSGGYFAFGGDDFDGFEAGPGGQLSLLLDLGLPVALGVTGTYGRGDVEGLDAKYREVGFGATGRYAPGDGSVGPYLGLHAGWTRLTVDLSPDAADVETNGFALGPSAGLEIPIGGIRLTLGGEVLWRSMGSVRLAAGAGDGGAKGWRYGAELGLVFAG